MAGLRVERENRRFRKIEQSGRARHRYALSQTIAALSSGNVSTWSIGDRLRNKKTSQLENMTIHVTCEACRLHTIIPMHFRLIMIPRPEGLGAAMQRVPQLKRAVH